MEAIIRRATLDDSGQLADLAKRGFIGYPFTRIYDPNKVAQGIRDGEHRVVAETGLGIIGTAVLGLGSIMAEIKREVVNPDQRGNGIASKMTAQLSEDAQSLGLIAYTDARADQPGMQKAALNIGQVAYSLEPGKHVVYYHEGEGKDTGPARETMVHLSSLQLNEDSLYAQLREWPGEISKALIENLTGSLTPVPKNPETSKRKLPSPEETALGIHEDLVQLQAEQGLNIESPDPDIDVVSIDHSAIMIIKPDASGFITQVTKEGLPRILEISKRIGLQVVTYYGDTMDTNEALMLYEAGMKPVMIRPWKRDELTPATWQVGWQRNMNDYEQCLHEIKLHEAVASRLTTFYTTLEKKVLYN